MRVIDFFDRGAALWPDRDFMIEGDRRQTYAEAAARSHAIANAMLADGYRRGTGVAVLSPNDMRAFDCVLGLFRAGALWVPINARNAVPANTHILNNENPHAGHKHPTQYHDHSEDHHWEEDIDERVTNIEQRLEELRWRE